MNFVIELGKAVVDTATAVVTYPVDIITEGPVQATGDLVNEIGTEVGNVVAAGVADPIGAVLTTLALDYNA